MTILIMILRLQKKLAPIDPKLNIYSGPIILI